MRHVRRTTVYVAVEILLVLAAAEIVARLTFPDFADDRVYLDRAFQRLLNSAVVFDPASDNFSRRFGFVLSPDTERTYVTKEFAYTCRTNSLGFRTKEIRSKAEGEYRVLLLGDSMFWGIGVADSQMVSSVIEAEGSPHVSVYNYSVGGYNTVQELLIARAYVDTLEPDHIILGFFIANDIIPNAVALVDSAGDYATSTLMADEIMARLRRSYGVLFHSVVFRIIALKAYVPRVRYEIATSPDVIAKSYDLIGQFVRLAGERDIAFSVVILYPRDSVRGGIVEAWSNSRRAGKLIYSYCRRNSIDALDLLEYMNTPEHKRRYFFPDDGHPNREGNRIMGRAIFKDLIEPSLACPPIRNT
jgi:hypothetical protein